MIESLRDRIAKAIVVAYDARRAAGPSDQEVHPVDLIVADAVLEAMRRPDSEMIAAGFSAIPIELIGQPKAAKWCAATVYEAMIDRAVREASRERRHNMLNRKTIGEEIQEKRRAEGLSEIPMLEADYNEGWK